MPNPGSESSDKEMHSRVGRFPGVGKGRRIELYDQNLQTWKCIEGWADSQGWGKGRVIESFDQNLQTENAQQGGPIFRIKNSTISWIILLYNNFDIGFNILERYVYIVLL